MKGAITGPLTRLRPGMVNKIEVYKREEVKSLMVEREDSLEVEEVLLVVEGMEEGPVRKEEDPEEEEEDLMMEEEDQVEVVGDLVMEKGLEEGEGQVEVEDRVMME